MTHHTDNNSPERPYILNEAHWLHVKDSDYDLAVLPWGATEPHNYHLPYGTDTIETIAIAEESARLASEQNAKVIVLPAIPFGVNTGQLDLKLTINLNPSTQTIILKDIIHSLVGQGLQKLCIFNGHGGNDFKQIIRELNKIFPDFFIFQISWFKIDDENNLFDSPGDHADEMETSLMMHIAKDQTLPLSQAGPGKVRTFRFKSFEEGWAWAPRQWTKISTDTGAGDPAKATAEKGKQYFQIVTEKIANAFQEIATAELNDLYK